jgi:hypothetical protein
VVHTTAGSVSATRDFPSDYTTRVDRLLGEIFEEQPVRDRHRIFRSRKSAHSDDRGGDRRLSSPRGRTKVTRLTFVRHGQSVVNAGGVTMERALIPLSPLGVAQAACVAALLQEFSVLDPALPEGMTGEQRRPIADAYWPNFKKRGRVEE